MLSNSSPKTKQPKNKISKLCCFGWNKVGVKKGHNKIQKPSSKRERDIIKIKYLGIKTKLQIKLQLRGQKFLCIS